MNRSNSLPYNMNWFVALMKQHQSFSKSSFKRTGLRKLIALLLLLTGYFNLRTAHAQNAGHYDLCTGLVVFGAGPLGLASEKPIPYSSDTTNTTTKYFTIEETTCPTCMACAEPTDYYKGPIHPFICGNRGMCFVAMNQSKLWRKMIIDTNGNAIYVRPAHGVYYSWRSWMILQGKNGEYLQRDSYNDQLVLYDKPYVLDQLPLADDQKLVGLKLKNIEDLRFVPVDVQGYWMKLHITDYRHKDHGYCWIIWRTETDWTFGFKWHAD